MDHLAKLAAAKEAFEQLTRMCELQSVASWAPTPEERSEYLRLADLAIDGVDHLQKLEARQLFSEGRIHSFLPEALLTFVRNQISHRRALIREAQATLDRDGAMLREIDDELGRTSGAGGLVRKTFEVGLEQVYDLIERNPDWGDDHDFLPDTAYEVFEAKLINFQPDDWLDRVSELAPVRVARPNVLPSHVRFRLEELFRAYVFGCWLSVLALCRSILEYALLDNLHKFRIEPAWQDRDGRSRDKKLSHVIDEVVDHLPHFREKLTLLRDYGNEYLHPKKTQVSKESLFRRKAAAKEALTALVELVESLYHAKKET